MSPKMLRRNARLLLSAAALLFAAGCPSAPPPPPVGGGGTGGGPSNNVKPAFSLAWSEYPSWSVFGVASEAGLIDGAEGATGPIEDKWGVDIVLKQADYDPCLQFYATGVVDAVCITNMDTLNPSLARSSVAILPTSTSDGADACLAVGVENIKGLQGKTVYGLEKSVSQYCFVRCLELAGEKEADYKFSNKDPGVAATEMVSGKNDPIMVWNPYVLSTLKQRPDAKVLFDSSQIPGEIIDMVVVAKDSLEKPGGKEFACAVIDAYYELNKLLDDPARGDETLVALGAKFSNLGLQDMRTVVKQTKFYKTPEAGLGVMDKTSLEPVMKTVVDFCVAHQIVASAPKIGYGPRADHPDAQFLFDPSYMLEVKSKGGGQ
jgi:ABC-type nitrate/sulfonate/bicarbonate transport system substrate-binding protein